MTEHPADSSGANDHYASTATLRAELATTLAHFTLHEVYQPLHTRIKEHQGSSRLDRFYISHSLAEECLFVPETTLPPHPHLPGSGADKGPSDHFPIRLHFTNGSIAKGVRFKIPAGLRGRKPLSPRSVPVCLSRSPGPAEAQQTGCCWPNGSSERPRSISCATTGRRP